MGRLGCSERETRYARVERRGAPALWQRLGELVEGLAYLVAIPVLRPELCSWRLSGGRVDNPPHELDEPVVLPIDGPLDRAVDVVAPANPDPTRVLVKPRPDRLPVLID